MISLSASELPIIRLGGTPGDSDLPSRETRRFSRANCCCEIPFAQPFSAVSRIQKKWLRNILLEAELFSGPYCSWLAEDHLMAVCSRLMRERCCTEVRSFKPRSDGTGRQQPWRIDRIVAQCLHRSRWCFHRMRGGLHGPPDAL